jgi:hypothetical protein
MSSNANDRTAALMPVKWQIEPTSPDGYYAYAWGGGLEDTVRTDVFPTEAMALRSLREELAKVGRIPDAALCGQTDKGREWLAVLS